MVAVSLATLLLSVLACAGNFPRTVNAQSGSGGCIEGSVRLAGGNTSLEGNVEVCEGGFWNQVCDGNWDIRDATVVCRQLDHSAFDSQAYGLSLFGTGMDPSGYSDFGCTSVEGELLSCPHDNRSSQCDANHLAGVRCRPRGRCEQSGHTSCCQTDCNAGGCWCDSTCFIFNDCCFEDIYTICSSVTNPNTECEDGSIQLVGGETNVEGRVEVCINGFWSSVCDQGWDALDAQVTCKQLNLPYTGARAIDGASYGQGNKLLLVSNAQCTGVEPSLSSCTYDSAEACGHHQDAGVVCMEDLSLCNHSSVRLVAGNTLNDGVIQVCIEGKWYFACDEDWGKEEAMVVCSQSGFVGEGAEAVDMSYFSSPISDGAVVSFQFVCSGNESSLLDCPYQEPSNCTAESPPVGVVCKVPCNDGELRVIGGSFQYEGRLEICEDQTWGTICQESWGSFDAAVACRQIGFSGIEAVAFGEAKFGAGVGPIHFTDFNCMGVEANLTQCTRSTVTDKCSHSMDVGIICSGQVGSCESAGFTTCCDSLVSDCSNNGCFCDPPCFIFNDCCDDVSKLCNQFEDEECVSGQIRLAGGTTNYEGRLELCFNGQWTTVCDNSFDVQDAKVACSQLGYPLSVHKLLDGSEFEPGNGYIAVGNLQCTGNESSILECVLDTTPDCSHHHDVELLCNVQNCTEGEIFLYEGDTAFDGTVEVCINGSLGTVCDDGWDNNDASVACRQLGFSSIGASAYGLRPASILPIITTLQCSGSEASLSQCKHSKQPTCNSHQAAGIRCSGLAGECEAAGFTTCCTGSNCSTGTCQCDGSCRDNQTCCSDINNICPLLDCVHGDIRLASGTSSNNGRVEICNQGRWSTVCHSHWSQEDAAVTCRNLGFPSYGSVPTTNDFYPLGSGSPIGGSFQCNGTETKLINCTFSDMDNCGHHEDAGVYCPNQCTEGEIRLANTADSLYSGRVEVCYKAEWVSACLDGWSQEEAQVVCFAVGSIKEDAKALPDAQHGEGPSYIPVVSINCTGSETGLLNCSIGNSLTCSLGGGAAVECHERCNKDGDLRLVGGESELEGQVEVCQNGFWGAICDNTWCESNAQVVCRQLGYSVLRSEAYRGSYFNNTSTDIFLDDVKCTGQEDALLDCDYTAEAAGRCDNESLASVVCYPKTPCESHQDGSIGCCVAGCNAGSCWCDAPCHFLGDCCEGIEHTCPQEGFCTEGVARLVNGTDERNGLVEICANRKFGTVCSSRWSDEDAEVVCASLGFPRMGAKAVDGSNFTTDFSPAVAGSFQCTGNETSLLLCQHTQGECCEDTDKAGVICPLPPQPSSSISPPPPTSFSTTAANETVSVEVSISMVSSITLSSATSTPPLSSTPSPSPSPASTVLPPQSFQPTSAVASVTPLPSPSPAPSCSNGDVRLVNGSGPHEGLVEMCNGNQWFQVCDNGWTSNDAEVVCRQLGYTIFSAQAYGRSFFGVTSNPFGYSNFGCSSDEDTLQECVHTSVNSSCPVASQGAAGVRCLPRLTGTCEANGVTSCCLINCNAGICWCDNGCYDFGDCCDDIDLTCPDSNVPLECSSGDIRLVGGQTFMEGRVEVCADGKWSTICDEGWDASDAMVVCQQLDLSISNPIALPGATFGQGSVPVLVTNFECSGNEQSLYTGCTHSTSVDCSHLNDAAVSCPVPIGPCVNGSVRVMGGNSAYEGQVQVCVNEDWVAVCDSDWSDKEASVVCQQLGFSGFEARSVNASGLFEAGSTNLAGLEFDFNCLGNEPSLLNCIQNTPGNMCGVDVSTVGVVCPEPCSNGAVRLVDGSNNLEGRVEVCLDGFWSSICDQSWSSKDAVIACRQLGFSSIEPIAYGESYFGLSVHPTLLTGFQCTGGESSLLDCPYSNSTASCDITSSAGVRCKGTLGTCEEAGHLGCCESGCFVSGCFCDVNCYVLNDCCPDIDNICPAPSNECNAGEIRLVGSNNDTDGRVELCMDGRWNSVCGDNWGNSESYIACSELGLVPEEMADLNFDEFEGYQSISIVCNGDESSPLDCTIVQDPDCTYGSFAAVACTNPSCIDGSVRLLEGANDYEGTVEICNGSQWSTICDNGWDNADATVICRQLGYSSIDASAYGDSFHSVAFTFPVLKSFHCAGNESQLGSCTTTPSPLCDSREVAGVMCLGQVGECEMAGITSCCEGSDCSTGSCSCDSKCRENGTCCKDIDNICPEKECISGNVQLVNGSSAQNGRVEICDNGRWRTICDEDWTTEEARVVCRKLGLPSYGALVVPGGVYPQGTGQPFGGQFRCSGTETSLTDCIYTNTTNCGHHNDAGVVCPSACTERDVRLVNFTHTYSGRVEMCYQGDWVSLCLDGWSDQEAQVICNQIGSYKNGATALTGMPFGLAPNYVQVVGIECTGMELNLTSCNIDGARTCSSGAGASVTCVEPCSSDGEVRLVGGSSPTEGQVEVCIDGAWSGMCDTALCDSTARVICQQLGFSSYRYEAIGGSVYNYPSQVIAMNNVQCSGEEANLTQCVYSTDAQCSASNLAGVVCYERSQCEILQGNSTGCCQIPGCTVVAPTVGFCFCDENCYTFNDCCPDIEYVCPPSGDCIDDSVRLVEGSSIYDGYVEICKDKRWSALCSEGWGLEEAVVVCRQLGILFEDASPEVTYTSNNLSQFIPIIGGEYQCSGLEDMITECQESFSYCCESDRVASVNCNATQIMSGTSTSVVDTIISVISTTIIVSSSLTSSQSISYSLTSPEVLMTTIVVSSSSASSQSISYSLTSSEVLTTTIIVSSLLTSSQSISYSLTRSEVLTTVPSLPAIPTSAQNTPTSAEVSQLTMSPSFTSSKVSSLTSRPVQESRSTSVSVLTSTSSAPQPSSRPTTKSSITTIPPTYPEEALENAVTIILGGFTKNSFTNDLESSFTAAVSASVSKFCANNRGACTTIPYMANQNSKRQTEYMVIVTDKVDNSEGSLEVTSFVLTSNGDILSKDALLQAVDEGIADGTFKDAGFSEVIAEGQEQETSKLSTATLVAIVFVVVLVVVSSLVVITITIIILMKKKSTKYNVFNNENPLTNNDQINLEEVRATEVIDSNIDEKLEEKVLEDLNPSDTKPIVNEDDDN